MIASKRDRQKLVQVEAEISRVMEILENKDTEIVLAADKINQTKQNVKQLQVSRISQKFFNDSCAVRFIWSKYDDNMTNSRHIDISYLGAV